MTEEDGRKRLKEGDDQFGEDELKPENKRMTDMGEN